MSYKLNLGAWGSVFAVPSAVVDEHLKVASANQLKVLLYLLKNNSVSIDNNTVGEALSMHPDDVGDALSFWVERGLLSSSIGEITPAESEKSSAPEVVSITSSSSEDIESRKPKRAVSRPVKPEPAHVARRLGSDDGLMMLMDEAQRIFGRVLSNNDAATLVMLHDTDGLPVDVILMLLQYCADNNNSSMRAVEKIGIEWGSEGINSVALAEEKIRTLTETYSYFNRVARTFGIKNVGSPTKKQLGFASCWVSTWSFSDDMLRLAYEKCVDTKGVLNMDYINGILKKWYKAGWKNPDEVVPESPKNVSETASKTKSKKPKNAPESDASYDIEAYEKKSIFD